MTLAEKANRAQLYEWGLEGNSENETQDFLFFFFLGS